MCIQCVYTGSCVYNVCIQCVITRAQFFVMITREQFFLRLFLSKKENWYEKERKSKKKNCALVITHCGLGSGDTYVSRLMCIDSKTQAKSRLEIGLLWREIMGSGVTYVSRKDSRKAQKISFKLGSRATQVSHIDSKIKR